MARRITMKEMKHDEFVEAAFDFTQWIEKHWKTVVMVVVAIVVVALLVYGWVWNAGRKRDEAAQFVAQGITAYERAQAADFADADELSGALDHFDSAIDASSRSAAGDSAKFYRGATLYRLGRTDEAITALREVAGGGSAAVTLDWTATSLLAEVYVESGQSEQALSLLSEAAARDEAAYPTDLVLLQLGRIQRDGGDEASARQSWQRIVDEFPDSAAASEANTLLAE
jgi:tetratricopeptide (TPR) repeat protein